MNNLGKKSLSKGNSLRPLKPGKERKKSKNASMRKLVKKDGRPRNNKDKRTGSNISCMLEPEPPDQAKEKNSKGPETFPTVTASEVNVGEQNTKQVARRAESKNPSQRKGAMKRRTLEKEQVNLKPRKKESLPESSAGSKPNSTERDVEVKSSESNNKLSEMGKTPEREAGTAMERERDKMYNYEHRTDAPMAYPSVWSELLYRVENPNFKQFPEKRVAAREWALSILNLGVEGLVAEFKPAESEFDSNLIKGYLEHPDLNRYNKQYCLDATRVKMPQPFEYFHGNYVSTLPSKKTFICCQAPMNTTCEAFWKMICQHEVQVIIMLCELSERNVEKCASYFPMKLGETKNFSDITIENNGSFEMERALPAKVTVTSCDVHYKPNKSLLVHHYHWRNWPDHGVPTTFLAPSRLLLDTLKTNQPILIHCSAGIGRTGTLVLIWALIDQLKHAKSIDTGPQLLNSIRAQRAHAVQNELQYLFAYRCVLEYLIETEILTKAEVEKFHTDYEAFMAENKKKRKREDGQRKPSNPSHRSNKS